MDMSSIPNNRREYSMPKKKKKKTTMQTSTKGMPVRGVEMLQPGGLLKGKSHDRGGIPAIVAGKKPIEMEGGEFVSSVSATDAFGKDNYAFTNDLGNRDPKAAKKLGKDFKKMVKEGGYLIETAGAGKYIEREKSSRKHGLKAQEKAFKDKMQAKEEEARKKQLKDAKKNIRKKQLKKASFLLKDMPIPAGKGRRKTLGKGIMSKKQKAKNGMQVEEYGLGDWIKKRVTPGKRIKKAFDVKGAAKRGLTGLEKGANWGIGKMSGEDLGFETMEQNIARKMGDAAKSYKSSMKESGRKAKGADAYLTMLSKTSKEKRKGAPGQFKGAKVGEFTSGAYDNYLKRGGPVMGLSDIANSYSTENYKAGGCVVEGGGIGDPVAVYNNKKR